MSFSVLLTDDAVRDLEELDESIAQHDGYRKAEAVLDKLECLFKELAELPARGSYPKELVALGIREYRQIFFKPYRIIYRVIDNRVYIMLIVDGRQDMQTLLARRLLGTD